MAPGGSDAGPGTLERPWATIDHAAETLEAGDTVYLGAGAYALTRQVRPRHMGAKDSWTVYARYPGETAVLDALNVDPA